MCLPTTSFFWSSISLFLFKKHVFYPCGLSHAQQAKLSTLIEDLTVDIGQYKPMVLGPYSVLV